MIFDWLIERGRDLVLWLLSLIPELDPGWTLDVSWLPDILTSANALLPVDAVFAIITVTLACMAADRVISILKLALRWIRG